MEESRAGDVPDPLDVERHIPQEVFAVASLVPLDGRNRITRHPQARDIVEVLALVCLDGRTGSGRDGGLSWVEVAQDLNHQFPGLDVTGPYLHSWVRTHVYPHVTIPKASLLSAIAEKRNGLNLFQDLMEHADETRAAFRNAKSNMNAIEYDKDGKPHRVGPSAADVAALSRATGKMLKEVREEAERFGVIPAAPVSSGGGVHLTVNLDAAMSNLSGKRKRVDPFEPVDAQAKPKE